MTVISTAEKEKMQQVCLRTAEVSYLSPRHEYFRCILCDLFGEEIENGELSNGIAWTGKVIQNICCKNEKKYFNLQHLDQQQNKMIEAI